MFSRRRRSQSLGRPTAPVSSSAQTAATQAFLSSPTTNANLSNAAAAAALRATASTPTQVSQVQTKRMLQRQSSVSSQGSAPGIGRGHRLQRRGSSGSMTERTFRTPSPSRSGSSSGQSPTIATAPPVPPLPQKYDDQKHRRAASLDPQPARVTSPSPVAQGGRGVSLERKQKPRPKSSQPALGNIIEQERPERPDSRNSINFSYPMGVRPTSPPANASPTTVKAPALSKIPETNGLSGAELSNVQQEVIDASNAPVKRKKKKKFVAASVEGSHLASGHTGGKPTGVAVDASEQEGAEDLAAQPKPDQGPVIENASKPKKKSKSPAPAATDQQPTTISAESDIGPSETSIREKRTQRAAGVLNKQPSVVREDWDGEQAAETQDPDISPPASPIVLPQSKKEAYAPNTTRQLDDTRLTSQTPPTLTTTMPSPEIGMDKPSPKFLEPNENHNAQRPPSVSPSRSRSARFSANLASDLAAEGRHEPPPRSVSPAKSVLKHHSPASQSRSPVDRVPGEWRLSSQTPSEASDTTSLASVDGVTGGRRKKHAHFSVDAEPEVVGSSSGDSSSHKTYHGLGTIPADEDMEAVFQPRPALPSFGSIRGKKDANARPSATNVAPAAEPSSSPSSASSSFSNMATMDTSVSSNHAIGALVAQDATRKQISKSPPVSDPNAPLPPVVTSVEGTGYLSDTDTSGSEDDVDMFAQSSRPPEPSIMAAAPIASSPLSPVIELPEPKTVATDSHFATTEPVPGEMVPREPVPQISVHPATPGTDVEDKWLVYRVPGGFPNFDAPDYNDKVPRTEEGPGHADTQTISAQELPASSPSDLGISEPKPPEAAFAQNSTAPPVGSLADALKQQSQVEDDSESEGESSIYSDAAEDFSDLEGDGFGSINAIVESPLPPSPPTRIVTPPDSPTAHRARKEPVEGWKTTQAHWSQVAEKQRQSSDKLGSPDSPQEASEPTKSKPRKKKTAPAKPIVVAGEQSVVAATQRPAKRPPQPASTGSGLNQGQASTMRKSMRAHQQSPADGPSLRGPGRGTGMKSSMRSPPPSSETPATSLPPVQAKGTLQKKNIPYTTPKATTSKKPLQRTASNDSDSSSSFKRRRRTMSTDGRYTMRRSMRSADDRPQSPAAPAGRGVRSMSPPQNRRPMSSGGPMTMRTTLRGSIDTSALSLRDKQKAPPGFGGFGKSSAKNRPLTTVPTPSPTVTNRFKSRFGNDSDDESPVMARQYASRFADSSDEESESLRPVRGIPRKTDEGDSTDLEDSSDNETNKRSKVKIASPKALETEEQTSTTSPLRRSGSGRDLGTSVLITTASPSQKKKGLFGRFRSKKVKEDSGIRKRLAESPARRDTHLERTQAELERARSPSASSPQHGKLQRRMGPNRVMSSGPLTSDSWPLPPKLPEENRPSTSDGLGTKMQTNGMRPELDRQPTGSTLNSEGGTVVGRSGRKKKFPLLRKAFGLSD